MAPPPKVPLRPLRPDETAALEQLSRTTSARLDQVQRARALLAVAAGRSFRAAATLAGFQSGYSVAKLVTRFNIRGLTALEIAPGRGRKATYDSRVRWRVLTTVRQPPDRARDGTATWSLLTLQTHLRTVPEGLPTISATTIRRFLHEAGYSYQRTRTWCATGTAQRVRKEGVVTVYDEATEEKKDA